MPILKPDSSEVGENSYTIPEGYFMVTIAINVNIFVPRDDTKPLFEDNARMKVSQERFMSGHKKVAEIVKEIEDTGRFPTEKCLHTKPHVSVHKFIRQYITNK